MSLSRGFLFLVATSCLGLVARAQFGVIDQVSPAHPPAPGMFVWMSGAGVDHQQVRAGRVGRLEGFQLQLYGIPGATTTVRIRMGTACTTSPAVFQGSITMSLNGFEDIYVDVTSAQIDVVPGTLFVIETDGATNPPLTLIGNYMDPALGPPLYSQPLFYVAPPNCFAECCVRLAFTTWVLESGVPYCAGDGSGTACPCANAGSAGHGCANSVDPAGARLASSGYANIGNDTLVLAGSGMPNGAALYFQGTTQSLAGAGTPFGDGLRCVSGQITGLGVKINSGGQSAYPQPGDLSISVRGANAAGDVRHYQCWYRNAAPFCTPATFNLTNAWEVTWHP